MQTKNNNHQAAVTKVLIIHQNFPGQFKGIAHYLSTQANVQVIGVGRDTAPGLSSVRCFRYTLSKPVNNNAHFYNKKMDAAVLHGQAVLRLLIRLKKLGFVPDVILGHSGWGETLYLKEVYPNAKLIQFSEWYYQTSGADLGFDQEFPTTIDDRLRIASWNAQDLISLTQSDIAITPTSWQKSLHPKIFHDKIKVIHEGIDTDNLTPDLHASLRMPNGAILKSGDPVITYVARNLEPYRGFHILMRTLPLILQQHPACHVVIVGGDAVSYGSPPKDAPNWREKMLREVNVDHHRVHFLGVLPYPIYKRVLQISAAHIYLTYPFVLSWSVLEAMATGCLVIASNTAPVKEVIEHSKNGLLVDFFSSQQILEAIGLAFADPTYTHSLRRAAMQTIRQKYSLAQGLKNYAELILNRETDQPTAHSNPAQYDATIIPIRAANSKVGLTPNPRQLGKIYPFRRLSDSWSQINLGEQGLTQRELQILQCLSQGMEDKHISAQLQISAKTVSTHVSNLMLKLNAKNRTHAVAKFLHANGSIKHQDATPTMQQKGVR